MTNPNRSSRVKTVILRDENEASPPLSGDFKPDSGLFDHFRKAEVEVPTEVDAVSLDVEGGEALRVLQFLVGINPSWDVDVNELEVETTFSEPVHRLREWNPKEEFVAGDTTRGKRRVKLKLSSLEKLERLWPGFGQLLPTLELKHETVTKSERARLEYVVRTVSDGQRKLIFKLRKNAKNGVDPKQFTGTITFSTEPDIEIPPKCYCFDLVVKCRVGVFSRRTFAEQKVAVFF